MNDWEITATTVYCDAVNDEVTLIIHRDGTARCTWQQKHAVNNNKGPAGKKNTRQDKHHACQGADCPRVIRYRDSLINA
jgi:hypothetical protein